VLTGDTWMTNELFKDLEVNVLHVTRRTYYLYITYIMSIRNGALIKIIQIVMIYEYFLQYLLMNNIVLREVKKKIITNSSKK